MTKYGRQTILITKYLFYKCLYFCKILVYNWICFILFTRAYVYIFQPRKLLYRITKVAGAPNNDDHKSVECEPSEGDSKITDS